MYVLSTNMFYSRNVSWTNTNFWNSAKENHQGKRILFEGHMKTVYWHVEMIFALTAMQKASLCKNSIHSSAIFLVNWFFFISQNDSFTRRFHFIIILRIITPLFKGRKTFLCLLNMPCIWRAKSSKSFINLSFQPYIFFSNFST